MQGIPSTFNGKPRRFVWEYRDANNQVQGYVARFDGEGKKEVIPYFKRVNGPAWEAGASAEPRPLFGLELLAQADPSAVVFVVEGEKAAAALQCLGLPAITSLGGSQASSKSDWSVLEGRKRVFILPDNDEPGEAYAKATAAILASLKHPPEVLVVHLPRLPAGGDVVDWMAAYIDDALLEWDGFVPVPESGVDVKALLQAFLKAINTHATAVPDEWLIPSHAVTEWLEPISLASPSLPAWPDDVFPEKVQKFVNELSAATETPAELAALMVLAVLSAAAHGKFRVQVKPDYWEPVNIWTCVALPPGNRKTSVQQAATKPLTDWEMRQREEIEPKIKEAESEHATMSARLAHLRKDAAQAEEAELEGKQKGISELEAELPEIPTMPQIWAQDITPENLATIMAVNNEKMAILSDEGGIFEILGGRYSKGVPNLDLFLQAHAGSPVRVNRASRPSIAMNAPSLALGLTPQPDLLRGLSSIPGFRGRGLLGRFLYALPLSNLGYRTLDKEPLDWQCCIEYGHVVDGILNQTMYYDEENKKEFPRLLELDELAEEVRQLFALEVEKGMREGEVFHHMTDWAGKLPGAVTRIAALLHIARHYNGQPWKKKITLQDMHSAICIGKVLSDHALAVFDLMGADAALEGARVILRWIIRKEKSEFTFRDCHHDHRNRYKRAADLEPVIEVLIERNFIRRRVEQVAHRPSRIYEVHPAVIKKID